MTTQENIINALAWHYERREGELRDDARDMAELDVAAYRLEILTAEATTIRNLPIPAEAGPHWHWYSLALNRAADHISRQGGTP